MKVYITVKHADGIEHGLSELEEELKQEIKDKFFEFGEYVRLEIDTDTMEATVVTND